MIIEKQVTDLKNVQPGRNYVLVEIDDSNEWIVVNGEKWRIDTTYEPERRAQQFGRVISCGEMFFEYGNLNSLAYNTPCEIIPGDTIMFHYLCVRHATKHNMVIRIDKNRRHVFIRYDELFVRIRDEQVYPLNGILLVEPKEETPKTFLIVPDIAKKRSKTRGTVKYAGRNLRGYRDVELEREDLSQVRVGDEVIFSSTDAVPLQDDLKPLLGFLYRMHRDDILGIFTQ